MKLKNNSRHSLVKWVAISTILVVVLATGGYFGFQYYQYYQADKIYSVDDIVSLPNFKIDITKSEFKSVDLSLDKDSITKYGGLDKQENCTTQSRERTWWKAWDNDPDALWVQLGPSDYDICNRRNLSRNTINEYLKNNDRLHIDYKIIATNNIDTTKLKIELVLDSGRKLDEQISAFKGNQFFPLGAQYKSKELEKVLDVPGPIYTSEREYIPYKPYFVSSLGGDINKGLERAGSISADIRKSEENIDLKVTYENQVRVIRIHR